MKILLVHTTYAERGGEDTVFANELEMLSEVAETETLTFSNTGSAIEVLKKFMLAPWNFQSARTLVKKIKRFKPDVVHIHNWHFAGSPALIHAAKKTGVPVVLTLHNYRLLCPSATLFSEGELFTESLNGGFPWKAVRKKVYRNSAIQTFWLAMVIYLHKVLGTWRSVDQYITLTDFAKELFLKSDLGLQKAQIITKANFVGDYGHNFAERQGHFLYVGRLTEDKGIKKVIEAFRSNGLKLKIIGDGPLRELVIKAAESNSNISYLGLKPHKEIITEMKKCSALIFPSIWYEGMPMTILEALSTATPVIASNLGAMKNLITDGYNGLLFDISGTEFLDSALHRWHTLPASVQSEFRVNARRSYEMRFTPEKNLNASLAIYKAAIDKRYVLNNSNNTKALLTKTQKINMT